MTTSSFCNNRRYLSSNLIILMLILTVFITFICTTHVSARYTRSRLNTNHYHSFGSRLHHTYHSQFDPNENNTQLSSKVLLTPLPSSPGTSGELQTLPILTDSLGMRTMSTTSSTSESTLPTTTTTTTRTIPSDLSTRTTPSRITRRERPQSNSLSRPRCPNPFFDTILAFPVEINDVNQMIDSWVCSRDNAFCDPRKPQNNQNNDQNDQNGSEILPPFPSSSSLTRISDGHSGNPSEPPGPIDSSSEIPPSSSSSLSPSEIPPSSSPSSPSSEIPSSLSFITIPKYQPFNLTIPHIGLYLNYLNITNVSITGSLSRKFLKKDKKTDKNLTHPRFEIALDGISAQCISDFYLYIDRLPILQDNGYSDIVLTNATVKVIIQNFQIDEFFPKLQKKHFISLDYLKKACKYSKRTYCDPESVEIPLERDPKTGNSYQYEGLTKEGLDRWWNMHAGNVMGSYIDPYTNLNVTRWIEWSNEMFTISKNYFFVETLIQLEKVQIHTSHTLLSPLYNYSLSLFTLKVKKSIENHLSIALRDGVVKYFSLGYHAFLKVSDQIQEKLDSQINELMSRLGGGRTGFSGIGSGSGTDDGDGISGLMGSGFGGFGGFGRNFNPSSSSSSPSSSSTRNYNGNNDHRNHNINNNHNINLTNNGNNNNIYNNNFGLYNNNNDNLGRFTNSLSGTSSSSSSHPSSHPNSYYYTAPTTTTTTNIVPPSSTSFISSSPSSSSSSISSHTSSSATNPIVSQPTTYWNNVSNSNLGNGVYYGSRNRLWSPWTTYRGF